MALTKRRLFILLGMIVAGIILGRLAVRGGLNLLVGGTMFGGDLL